MSLPPPSPREKLYRVLVLGSGNFGSCLADHLADSEHNVTIWSRSAEVVQSLNSTRRNPNYLTEHVFPDKLKAIGPAFPDKSAIDGLDVLLFAIPTEGLRKTLTDLRPLLNIDKLPLLIFVNKGIELKTQALSLEIIADTCGKEIATVSSFVSGPSFAKEIIKRQPTSVSVVSLSQTHAEAASKVFHQPWFRCYPGTDPIGVELAGALKNVYAIVAGMADGLGFENNTRATIITRSLAEMTRIGTAYGANPLTFLSLAGVGDLFLTCSSPTSRNYTVGYRMGKGEKLKDVIETLGSVAEGVTTCKSLKILLDSMQMRATIATMLHGVLFEDKDVKEQARLLMAHPMIAELDLVSQHSGGPVENLMKKLGIEKPLNSS